MNKISFVPSVWGSSAWKFLHTIALSYPQKPTQQDKSDFKQFFLLLEKTLPCETCATNFKQHIKEIPIDDYLSGPHELFSWTVKMRNAVQKVLGRSLYNEESLRENLYIENEKAGGWLDIHPKFKIILWILLAIFGIFAIFKIAT